tara:strand:- start:15 stop:221 length:207 start_codon:yes stop_codon:yes gene_type:complete
VKQETRKSIQETTATQYNKNTKTTLKKKKKKKKQQTPNESNQPSSKIQVVRELASSICNLSVQYYRYK